MDPVACLLEALSAYLEGERQTVLDRLNDYMDWRGKHGFEPAVQVRALLPKLKPGMTEAEVKSVLSGVTLGEETLVSRTVSGGKTVRYRLSARESLELTFIPHSFGPSSPRLTDAQIMN